MTEEEWDSVIDVHLKGHFAPARFAGRVLAGRRARRPASRSNAAIVNTASESGLYGNAGQANYAAAKAGIASMTIVMARELERLGVRVNAIAPVAPHPPHRGRSAGDYMKPNEAASTASRPRTSRRSRAGSRPTSPQGITGQVREGAGRHRQLLAGLAAAHRGHRRQGVDDRDRRRPPRRSCFAKSDAGVPPFFFASPPDG